MTFRHRYEATPPERFRQSIVRLGFTPAEVEGRKVVRLTFLSPDRGGCIEFRIPFRSDEQGRITLLEHEAAFAGEWRGYVGIPPHIREEAFRKLRELIDGEREDARDAGAEPPGSPATGGGDGGAGDDPALSAALNGVMAQDEDDLVRLGKEMKAMKTNTELEREGMIPDPIQ
ncbi:hypothetical protein [Paenibacillus flagellatus]|uniref:Uncharacterized protein n=1 Tax=Paenibacillus flagellatus TaxID=2211139 RepID=A0A2V5JZC7_9BACL|nr:hypothetical protein [Paenibacillus flagellatus]PYI50674.1 hypothetical protein DLM86_28295 [Paenibacillus flagellatus]